MGYVDGKKIKFKNETKGLMKIYRKKEMEIFAFLGRKGNKKLTETKIVNLRMLFKRSSNTY